MANWLWLIAHYQTRKGNQGGNQGDDSTGQHYSVTGRTLHMLIRPGEERGRDGQMEGGGGGMWNGSWRNTEIDLKSKLIAQITKKKKNAMPREGCRHSMKITKTGKFTRLSDSKETDEIFLTGSRHRFGRIAWILSPAQHLCWKQAKLLFTASFILIEKLFLEMPKELQYTQICILDFPERRYAAPPPHHPPPPHPLTQLFSEVLLRLDRLSLILINEM